MNLKKSKTSVHKLFLALCILGSGIHVHAVESSTGASTTDGAETINTFVRPNSVEQADRMLVDAARAGNVDLVDRLLECGFETVRDAFQNAEREGNKDTMSESEGHNDFVKELLQYRRHNDFVRQLLQLNSNCWVSQSGVRDAFKSAVRNGRVGVMNRLLQMGVDRFYTRNLTSSWLMNLLLRNEYDNRKVPQCDVWHSFFKDVLFSRDIEAAQCLLGLQDDRRPTERDVGEFLRIVGSIGHRGTTGDERNTEMLRYLTSENCPVRPDQRGVNEALEWAGRTNHITNVEHLTSDDCRYRPTREGVESAFWQAVNIKFGHNIEADDTGIVQHYLGLQGVHRLTQGAVQQAFLDAMNNQSRQEVRNNEFCSRYVHNVIERLLNDDRITPDFLTPLLEQFVDGEGGISAETARMMVVGPDGPYAPQSSSAYSQATTLMKLRHQEAGKTSRLPKDGVFRCVLEYAIQPQLSAVRSDGQYFIPDPELAKKVHTAVRNLDQQP